MRGIPRIKCAATSPSPLGGLQRLQVADKMKSRQQVGESGQNG